MVYTNLDAEYLSNLASTLSQDEWAQVPARLVQIANNLQRMDERSVSAYSQGFADGEEAFKFNNSNIIPKSGPANLEEALKIWRGETTKQPPVKKVPHKSTLTADDLDFDEDFEEYLAEAEKKVREARAKKKDESNPNTVRNPAAASR